jgi:hypothetical protein
MRLKNLRTQLGHRYAARLLAKHEACWEGRKAPYRDKNAIVPSTPLAALSPNNLRSGGNIARRTLSAPDTICRRTAGDLLGLVHARVEERARLLEAKRAAEAARRKAGDEANRSRYLDQLGKREEATWNRIVAHIQKRQPNEYDKAVNLLIDLRDLALRQSRVAAFQSALGELRQEHAAKESLLRRLAKPKL